MAWLLVLLPLAGAGMILVVRRYRAVVIPVAVGSLVVLLGVGIAAAAGQWTAGWSWGPRLDLTLSAEGLGRLMVVVVPAIAAPVVAYAASYESEDPGLPRLLALLVAFAGAMELLVAAADLLTLLLGWELVAVCSWALIGHRWRERGSTRAATEAFVVTAFGALGLYLAAGAALSSTGSLSFAALSAADGVALHVIAAGVLLAAAAKSAQVPFSPWLFAAMEGPTPVSALLHSATMVAARAYALARLAPALSGAGWLPAALVALGLAGALAGGVVALVQRDIKRALAGSTTAQYGLVLIAVGAGSTAAASVHLATHAAFKALLFLGAGVAIHAAGTEDLGGFRLGRALRWPALLFGVGVLSLAAVPPLGGGLSKALIAGVAGRWGTWVVLGVLGAGLLSAAYGGRLFLLAYAPGDRARARAAPPEVRSMAVLAAASVGLGILWIPGASRALARLVGDAVTPTVGFEGPTLVGIAAAFAAVWWLDRRGVLISMGLPDGLRARAAAWLGIPVLGRRAMVDPVLALAAHLSRFDDRVVDAGIRTVGRLSDAFSRLLSWWGERGVDGVVQGVAWSTFAGAGGSRLVDERGVDAAVEGLARGVGVTGAASRRLQTGLAHRNYVVVAVGVVAVVLAAVLWK